MKLATLESRLHFPPLQHPIRISSKCIGTAVMYPLFQSRSNRSNSINNSKLEFLLQHVNAGRSPFALLAVFGDVDCSCMVSKRR